jgi:myo-inositol 2-dehydrogenase/D-chiro-inositol 1-dehydrogenase
MAFHHRDGDSESVIHEIDIVRWLLDEEIASAHVVTGRRSSLAPSGVNDPHMVMFQMVSGALVDVESFINSQYGYDISCQVVGEKGTAYLAAMSDARVSISGAETTAIPADYQERFADAFRRELQGWVDSIRAGSPVGADAWDGYAATAVAQACRQSLADHDRPSGVGA